MILELDVGVWIIAVEFDRVVTGRLAGGGDGLERFDEEEIALRMRCDLRDETSSTVGARLRLAHAHHVGRVVVPGVALRLFDLDRLLQKIELDRGAARKKHEPVGQDARDFPVGKSERGRARVGDLVVDDDRVLREVGMEDLRDDEALAIRRRRAARRRDDAVGADRRRVRKVVDHRGRDESSRHDPVRCGARPQSRTPVLRMGRRIREQFVAIQLEARDARADGGIDGEGKRAHLEHVETATHDGEGEAGAGIGIGTRAAVGNNRRVGAAAIGAGARATGASCVAHIHRAARTRARSSRTRSR